MKKRNVVIVLSVIVIAGLWFLFSPGAALHQQGGQ